METTPGLKPLVLVWLVKIVAITLLLRITQEEEVVKSHSGDEWKKVGSRVPAPSHTWHLKCNLPQLEILGVHRFVSY